MHDLIADFVAECREMLEALRETLATGGSGPLEPRAMGAWLAHSLAAQAGGSIRLSDPSSEVLLIGASIRTSA